LAGFSRFQRFGQVAEVGGVGGVERVGGGWHPLATVQIRGAWLGGFDGCRRFEPSQP
jgi:hypothetical protein